MATTTARVPTMAGDGKNIIRGAAIWQALLALTCLGGAVGLLLADWGERDWLRWIAFAFAAAGAPLNGWAALLISRRQQRGRLIAMIVNYLIAVGAALGMLGVAGFFDGLDVVATRFYERAWWLVLVLAGYLIGSFADRMAPGPSQQQLRRISNGVMLAGFVILLVLMGLFEGLLALLIGLATQQALLLLVISLLSGTVLAILWRDQVAQFFGATSRDSEMISGYAFIAPNLLGFMLFFAGPLLLSLFLSFTNSDSFSYEFTGIENYARIFSFDIATLDNPTQRASEVLEPGFVELGRNILGTNLIIGAQDRLFWVGLWNTFVYCFWTTLLAVVPALLVANILNSKIPGMTFFRAIYFIPSIAGVVGVAVIWKWLYNSNVGFLNYGLDQLAEPFRALGFAIEPFNIPWLASQETALASIIVMAAWQILGFNTILFLAGLQGIPGEIYEASTLDGAGTWQRFRYMTLPLLAPTTFFVVTTTLIQTLQVFSEVFVLTPPPGGGPNNATLTSVLYLYQQGFSNFQQGYAAAVAWVLFLFIFAVTLIQFRIQRAYGDA